MGLETAAVRRLRQALGTQFEQVMRDAEAGKPVQEIVAGLSGSRELRTAVERTLLDAADAGVMAGAEAAAGVVGIDWTLANVAAREWAARYVGELVTKIDETTRQMVREAVARRIETGEPLRMLARDLTAAFGRQRAELIAATETTRAYAEGNVEAWKQTGRIKKKEWMTARDEIVCAVCGELDGQVVEMASGFGDVEGPPAHPGCRCALAPVVE